MSFKFHWGHGVSLFLAVFIVFILTFVYKTLADSKYDHKLVSDDYYNEEMYYQQEVDRLANAAALKNNLKLEVTETGISLNFPEQLKPENISGYYQLQRTNDAKMDIKEDIHLDSLSMLIPARLLNKGVYNVKVIWHYDSIPYQLNEQIVF